MTTSTARLSDLPVAVIGAGPVGLAAAARLVERGLTPLVLERGRSVGASLLAWGHISVFSPWAYNIDAAARSLLDEEGWTAPDPEGLPTGAEIVEHYLRPLAAHPRIAHHVLLDARVLAVTRRGLDKLGSAGRDEAPFRVLWEDAGGHRHAALAQAVLDASGSWGSPNPIGIDGLPVPGEAENRERLAYGIPDVLGSERARYAGNRVLVVGGGHSATNVVLNLLRLQESAPETRILWALRRERIDRLIGGGLNDQLPERGALGLATLRAIETGRVTLLAPFAADRIAAAPAGLRVEASHGGAPLALDIDRIVVATGFRPDLSALREIRIALDSAVEAPPALAPLIDPNLHSCGTVRPHGAAELRQPEPGFYIVGSKSYGRAPTFLMATGYEQVRSVVAEIAGDHAAARDVRLVLPETGVCNSRKPEPGEAGGCCGGPAAPGSDDCCVADAEAKAAGRAGCGCTAARPRAA